MVKTWLVGARALCSAISYSQVDIHISIKRRDDSKRLMQEDCSELKASSTKQISGPPGLCRKILFHKNRQVKTEGEMRATEKKAERETETQAGDKA